MHACNIHQHLIHQNIFANFILATCIVYFDLYNNSVIDLACIVTHIP